MRPAGPAGACTRRCPSHAARWPRLRRAARSSSRAASSRTARRRPGSTPSRRATNSWRRLPDLPVAVNHAMAAGDGRRLFVVGGYSGAIGSGQITSGAWMLTGGRWWPLPALPEGRAAGGAAVVAGRLYVVGGVAPTGLATKTLVLHLGRMRWSTAPGPAPREHLAVTSARGRIYALGGRRAGIDTNVATFQSVRAGRQARGSRSPPVPSARGGTAAAVASGRVVSIGGEEPNGTIRSVYAYDLAKRRWSQLPDLPTPTARARRRRARHTRLRGRGRHRPGALGERRDGVDRAGGLTRRQRGAQEPGQVAPRHGFDCRARSSRARRVAATSAG